MWRASISFDPLMPSGALAVLALAALVVLLVMWRASGTLPAGRRRALTALRALLLAGLVLSAAGPGLRRERVSPVPGTALVLVDRSASMDLEARRTRVTELMNSKALEALRQRFSLLNFGFSDRLQPLSEADLVRSPDGEATKIVAALEAAAAAVEGSPIAGVALITDGVNGEGKDGLKARLEALGAPVFVMTPPSERSRDLALDLAEEAPVAFVRNTRTIKLRLRARGLDGHEARVKIELPGAEPTLRSVLIDGDEAEVELPVEFKPMRVGHQVLRLSVPVLPGEEDATNNELLVPMEVVRDRLRVLLVAGAPTWDVRFLRRLLKEDPGVDLVSFFILRTPEDTARVPEHELSLIPFPERELFEEQLHTFDVVIFQDFNFRPYSVAQYLGRVRRFVEDDGGGFAMIGGQRSFFEGEYGATEIAETLPVGVGSRPVDLRPFVPVVQAPDHPILNVGGGQSAQDLFSSLPQLRGRNRLGAPKPGASVLLTHPSDDEPVLVAAPMGRGRALALAVDSLWRWQLEAGASGQRSRPYYRLWHNMLRWLSGDPAFSRMSWEEVPKSLVRGQALQVSLRLRGHDWQAEAGVPVRIVARRGTEAREPVVASTDEQGRVTFELGELPPGAWTLRAEAGEGASSRAIAEATVIAGQPLPERRNVGPDMDHARAIARVTGGEVFDWSRTELTDLPFDEDRRGERVEAVRFEPLWNHPAWVLTWLLAGLLAIGLRRRWQLA